MASPLRQEKATMLYKTIVLELIHEQYPALHEQLRTSRTLLATVNDNANALKRYHEDWTDRLTQAKPDKHPSQIASEALELAILDLRDNFPSESPQDEMNDQISLDDAMAYIRHHTPPA
jgi:hypothetical protein